jgi:hypothetical protein
MHMHTITCGAWKIHHDSDWEGQVLLSHPGRTEMLEVPAKVFRACAADMVSQLITGAANGIIDGIKQRLG